MTMYRFEHMRSIVTVHNFVNFTIRQTAQLLAFLVKTLDGSQLLTTFCGLLFQYVVGSCEVYRECEVSQ